MDHTYSASFIYEVRINNKAMSKAGLNGRSNPENRVKKWTNYKF